LGLQYSKWCSAEQGCATALDLGWQLFQLLLAVGVVAAASIQTLHAGMLYILELVLDQ
jgi:hypothetical protein